jgi:hypothetical protein
MKQILEINVPNDYSAITLTKFLQLQKDLKVYGDDEEAKLATLFYHLCNVEPGIMQKIDTATFIQIKEQLLSFIARESFDLKPFVNINGVEYGFEPNLSEIAYGAYVDISKFDELNINENWEKIMAILYRPVKKKIGKLYEIEQYTGNEPSEHWREVNMEIHFGALFFFINLSKALLKNTLKSLIQTQPEIPANIKSILAASGALINQSSLFAVENSLK